MGRRHIGAQGDTDELPPLGGLGRRAAGRDRRGARPGSVLVDQRASPAAGAARVAGADLPSPPPRPRSGRPEAVEVDPFHRAA